VGVRVELVVARAAFDQVALAVVGEDPVVAVRAAQLVRQRAAGKRVVALLAVGSS
jgi:hypothetical protein